MSYTEQFRALFQGDEFARVVEYIREPDDYDDGGGLMYHISFDATSDEVLSIKEESIAESVEHYIDEIKEALHEEYTYIRDCSDCGCSYDCCGHLFLSSAGHVIDWHRSVSGDFYFTVVIRLEFGRNY